MKNTTKGDSASNNWQHSFINNNVLNNLITYPRASKEYNHSSFNTLKNYLNPTQDFPKCFDRKLNLAAVPIVINELRDVRIFYF